MGTDDGGPLDPKAADLADRMKSLLDDDAAAQRADAERRERRRSEGHAARLALMAELQAFAERIGHISCASDEDQLILRFRERTLRFVAEGQGDLRVTIEGWPGHGPHRLYREADLNDRWVLVYRKHARDEKMPLFDKGLEELLVSGLGLPRPESEERPMAPRTAAAMAGPSEEPPLRVLEGRAAKEPDAGDPSTPAPAQKPRRL